MYQLLKKYWPELILSTLSFLIISIWFQDGKLLATGEDGLMLVNPSRFLELYKHSWNEVRSGGSFPGSNAMLPFFYIETYITALGIPIWLFQAITFYILMLVGSYSTYLLTKELFRSLVRDSSLIKISFMAALFYILNPFSLLGVWYRGVAVYSLIFFYALAPLFFYLYVLGLKNKNYLYIFVNSLVTLPLSSAFATPANPFLIWLLPIIYSTVTTFVSSSTTQVKFRAFPLVYFIVAFIYWTLTNFWWILPYIEFSNIVYFSESSLTHAIGTLKANSSDFNFGNVVRLIHGGFLYKNEAFGSIYKSLPFLFISWLIPVITIYGLLTLRAGQIKLFFALSMIFLLFSAKGTSPPLGGVFLWFFTHISFLQVFRNPLEKFGLLLPIIYAPLFSLGTFYLLLKVKRYRLRTSLFRVVIICFIISNWPFFTGALVHFRERDIRVEIPTSFRDANKVLTPEDHIILSLPVMGGASGRYKWKYKYAGIESSHNLFNYPVVNVFYDANLFYSQLLIALSQGQIKNNLVGIAQFFSADVIAYRKDTDIAAFGYKSSSPEIKGLERSARIIKDANLLKVFDSQELSLFVLPDEKIVPVIYTPSSIRIGESADELISLIESHQFDPKNESFICAKRDSCKPYVKVEPSQIKIDSAPENIEIKKISPTNYEIQVKKSKGKFLLIFNNSYHPGWTAYIEEKPVSQDKHIVANGYANGFIIVKAGNFNINLRFLPEAKVQKYNNISYFVIVLEGLIVIVYVGHIKQRCN